MPYSEALSAIWARRQEVVASEHRAMRGGKRGLVNKPWDRGTAPAFDVAARSQDGKARLKVEGQCKAINSGGEFTSEPQAASSKNH